jgi:hypothetical protein
MMCPASRTLLAAALVGMAVSSLFASDAAGWIAAIAAGLAVHLVQRRRPALASCGLPAARASKAGPQLTEPRTSGHSAGPQA